VGEIFTLSNADAKTGESRVIGLMGWLPPDYNDDPSSLHPCVITIQGSLGLGSVKKLTNNGPLRFISKGHNEAFVNASAIVISPAMSKGFSILDSDDHMNMFVDYITDAFKVDPDRLSMIGLSFGGGIVWNYGKKHADRLSVMAPSCAHANPARNSASDYAVFSQTTIWAFSAVDDKIQDNAPILPTGRFSGSDKRGEEGWMGGIAAAIGDLDSSRMLDSYPVPIEISTNKTIVSTNNATGHLSTRTSAYSLEDGWVWSDGMNFIAGKRHQMTLIESGGRWNGTAWMTPWFW
jgi:pimeloyl-ACP methyl ester carboxylesterase